MRTNIDLDDALLARAMKYSTARSKRGVVHEALAAYVATKAEQLRLAAYRNRLAVIRRKAAGSGRRTPVTSLVREDRDRQA